MARYRFQFWLDANKDDELLLCEDIEELKASRLFTKTIRDGIRLVMDLRRGSLDVLLELFPDLRHKLKTETNGNGGAGGSGETEELHRRIRMLETVVMQQANFPTVARSTVMDVPALPSAFVTAGSSSPEPPDPAEARAAFSAGLGNLFDDDDDF